MNFYKHLRKLNESILLEYNRKDLRNWAGDEYAAKFFALRDRLQAPENNLDHWIKKGDVAEFKKFIDDWESGAKKSKTQQKKEERIKGAELVFDDKGWKVYHVTEYDAAKQLGSGTTWCITGRYHGYESRGKEYFNSYINRYNLDGYYFIFDTENRDENTNDYLKYCAGFSKRGDFKFLYNGMQDNEISHTGIPGIPPERRVQPFKEKFGYELPYFDTYDIKDGILVKVNKPNLYDEELPDGVIAIGKGAFKDTRVHLIKFPDTLEKIGRGAFESCKNLHKIVLPSSVKVIESGAFIDCSSMVAFDMRDTSVEKLGIYTFAYCEELIDVYLPSTISNIAANAFDYANKVNLYTTPDNEYVINYAKQNNLNCLDIDTGEILRG